MKDDCVDKPKCERDRGSQCRSSTRIGSRAKRGKDCADVLPDIASARRSIRAPRQKKPPKLTDERAQPHSRAWAKAR
jgi:hypothetical protein